jgi:glucose/arabinose dehydrogenase
VSRQLRRNLAVVVSTTAVTIAILAAPGAAPAATYPTGFSEQVVFSGHINPTAIRFASDGRVFVAEKSGLVKVYDSLSDQQPDTFADLRTQVHNFWDRGLLGLALHPDFPNTPYVYVLYTYDAAIGGTAPRWGTPGATSDPCPNPPGATADGCVVSGRLSRLTASGNAMVGTEQVLIEDWCQQYPSHSIGSLNFGSDGALYVSGGDGASFNFVDYGQDGSPTNPCATRRSGLAAS